MQERQVVKPEMDERLAELKNSDFQVSSPIASEHRARIDGY